MLFLASTRGGQTTVQGTLTSRPNIQYTIQFFENDQLDIAFNNFGEGQRFAGSTTVSTDATGFASFQTTLNGPVPSGQFITATATDDAGNTSEFSQGTQVVSGFFTIVDLGVDVVDSPDPIFAGDTLTYAVTVRNFGFSQAPNPIFSTTLPNSLILQTVSASQGTVSQSGNTINVNVGLLAAGQAATITITATPTVPGTLTSRFMVSGSLNDPFPGNDVANVDTQVILNPADAVLSLSDLQYGVAESGGRAVITVNRSNNFDESVTVGYETVAGSGTATAGQDYIVSSGTLSFAPTVTERSFTVPILDNNIFQGNRNLQIRLLNPGGQAILGTPNQSTLTIFDDDPANQPAQVLQFAQMTYNVQENGGNATVTVQRTGSTQGTVSVNYSTSNGTAVAGTDYTPASGTLTFADGQATASFTVPILDNAVLDGNRSFNVALGGSIAAVVGPQSTAEVAIIDDESPLSGFFQFAAPTFSVSEADGTATITVTRSGGIGPAAISYATVPGTAQAGVRYTPVSGTLNFGPLETSQSFTIPILNDTSFEGPQTVGLTLAATGDALIGTPRTATLTINDDDLAPPDTFQFSAPIYTVDEGGGAAVITVTRSGFLLNTATIGAAATGGTATPGLDYTPVFQTLTFGPGESTKTFSVPIIDNSVVQPGQQLVELYLGYPTGNTVIGAEGSALLEIANNDFDLSAPTVTGLTLVPSGGGIGGATLSFSEPMNTAALQNPLNYSAVDLGRDGRAGTADDRLIPIVGVMIDPTGQLATLVFATPVPAGEFVAVAAAGTGPGGLADLSGNLLDGNNDGVAGGVYLATIARGSRLSYRDADGDFVQFRLTGGTLELTRDAQGNGQVLNVLGQGTSRRPILQGYVRRARGGNGTTTLTSITGLIPPFGRVRPLLRTPPFFVASQVTTAGIGLRARRV